MENKNRLNSILRNTRLCRQTVLLILVKVGGGEGLLVGGYSVIVIYEHKMMILE